MSFYGVYKICKRIIRTLYDQCIVVGGLSDAVALSGYQVKRKIFFVNRHRNYPILNTVYKDHDIIAIAVDGINFSFYFGVVKLIISALSRKKQESA